MSIKILTGDCRQTLAALPEKSVQCCVTSPPYFGLRDYNVEGQIGLEPKPEEYVREMVLVFRSVRRVLKDDGVLWLNLGDSYAGSGKGAVKEVYRPSFRPGSGRADGEVDERGQRNRNGVGPVEGFKQKDLMLIPWRVAMALQSDGWYLRAACPWIKRNGMPDSTQDRPTQCVETIFMLTKSKRCFYDAEAVKITAKTGANGSRFDRGKTAAPHEGTISTKERAEDGKRLRRTSDWFFESWQGLLLDHDDEPSAFVVNLKGYKEAHFATFPPKLVEPCILSSTSEHGECPDCGMAFVRVVEKTPMVIDRSERTHEMGRTRSSGTMVEPAKSCTTGWRAQCQCGKNPIPQTVLDPFGGSGTTGFVAAQFNRNAILCELNAEYVALAEKRCGLEPQPLPLDE